MKKELLFDYQFKGSRTYVHGTDIYNSIVDFLKRNNFSDIRSIDFSMHEIVSTNLYGILTNEEQFLEREHFSIKFNFLLNQEKYKIALKENGEEISQRYNYQEDDIIAPSIFNLNDKSISLNQPFGFTPIENIVALNKSLHYKLFGKSGGKWYFTRLQSVQGINEPNPSLIKLTLQRNFHLKLTKTEIHFDNSPLGFIYFSFSDK